MPVVAQLMGIAASGGYYVAIAADEIHAQRTTVTGSIGVIFAGVNLAGLMEKLGVENQTITSGAYKDAGSLLRRMRPEERAQLQTVIDDLYERFVEVVQVGPHEARRPSRSARSPTAASSAPPRRSQAGSSTRSARSRRRCARARARRASRRRSVVTYHRPREYTNNYYTRAPRQARRARGPVARRAPDPGPRVPVPLGARPRRSPLARLHLRVVGPLAALGRRPRDHLIGICDVAGLAVHAVLVVDEELPLPGVLRVVDHLVDGRRAERLARIAVLLGADVATQIGVGHDQVRRLIRLVRRAAEADQVLLREGELAVELELLPRALVLRQLGRASSCARWPASVFMSSCEAAAVGEHGAERLVQEEERHAALHRRRRSCAPDSARRRPSSCGSARCIRRASWR